MRKGRAIPLSFIIFLFLSSCQFKHEPFDEAQWHEAIEKTDSQDLYRPHEGEDGFYNPWMVEPDGRFFQFLKWRLSASAEYTEEQNAYLPDLIPGLLTRIKQVSPDDDFFVWIGHATFLFRIDGIFWLTDPMLSDRALLPKRVTPPALTKRELALLDGELRVLISHNHYDHLDAETIQALPASATILVPLGLKNYLETLFAGKVVELDWWQRFKGINAVVTCLPAQHWSRRLWQSHNTTLWASYMIQSQKYTIYFGGDSGYFVGYKEFGKLFPVIDYALLPITAYHPRWFMHYPHIDVNEALMAFHDLNADYFVPTQWGTFHLGENPPGFPMLELNQKIHERDLDADRYLRPALGEIILLKENDPGPG